MQPLDTHLLLAPTHSFWAAAPPCPCLPGVILHRLPWCSGAVAGEERGGKRYSTNMTHTYVHACWCLHIQLLTQHTYICTYMRTDTQYRQSCTHATKHVSAYVHPHTHTHTHPHTHTHTPTPTHTHTHTHIHTHTHTHTHTQPPPHTHARTHTVVAHTRYHLSTPILPR